jgi:hypothetical protein
VHEFLEAFSTLAIKSLNGHPAPGVLQLSRLPQRGKRIVISRYRLDEVDSMVSATMAACESRQNAFIEGRLVSFSADKRGKFEDTICVFALVIDSDADKGMAWSPLPGVRPTLIIETSPGNYHYWFFFREAIARERARALGKRIKSATRTDADTGVPTQPYRIAGTVNYPDATKVARGRVDTGVALVACDPTAIWTPEELEAVFPTPQSARGAQGGGGAYTSVSGDIDIDAPGFLPELREAIVNSVPIGHRSDVFYWVAKGFQAGDYTVDQVFACLLRHSNGIAWKYLDPNASGSPHRLRQNIQAVYDKPSHSHDWVSGLIGAVAASRAAPSSPSSGKAGLSNSALIDAHATSRKWLGEKYDTGVLDAVASAGAAERLGGDPLWLMVISGSGNAKTETVQPLEGAGAIVTSTISGEGALLSATARSHGATGGLLRKIGVRGLLVIKDFTTILLMDGKARSVVLAALREIHDGRWERNVGYAGGRTLPWAGRIVVVAACTTAWDEAHKAIEALGDRFALVRSDSTKWRQEAARQAIGNAGNEATMRTELARTMGALVNSADLSVRQLDDAEKERLIRLADLATWARSGVERDYRGGIINAHAPEMPTRFAKQLAMVMRGALSIGIPDADAMRLAARCARDSLEPLRLELLLDITANPGSNPDGVHKRTRKPLTTVKNMLVALHTLGLLACQEQEERHGSRTFTVPYYWIAPEVDRIALLSL